MRPNGKDMNKGMNKGIFVVELVDNDAATPKLVDLKPTPSIQTEQGGQGLVSHTAIAMQQ
jgi:hypothetical protein